MDRWFWGGFLLALSVLIAAHPASAVIIAGANGGADTSNNTTRTELEALPSVSDGFFFDNVFRVGAGNAVYLGYRLHTDGAVAYALSGMHLGSITSVTIEAEVYDVVNRIAIDDSDLALFGLTHVDGTMPSLRPLTLSSAPITNDTPVVMIGEGRNRIQNATTDAYTSDAITIDGYEGYETSSDRLKRWGTNSTSDFAIHDPPGPPQTAPTITMSIDGRNTVVFRTVFSEPAAGEWLTTNEAQAVVHDSGGGVFAHDGTLLGVMLAVATMDGEKTNALFGNATYMADIATYKDAIDSTTGGALIPEPRAAVMLVLAGAVLGLRRKSRRPA